MEEESSNDRSQARADQEKSKKKRSQTEAEMNRAKQEQSRVRAKRTQREVRRETRGVMSRAAQVWLFKSETGLLMRQMTDTSTI